MNYDTLTIQDIMAWCQANKQVDWLKAEAKKEVIYKVYPKVKGEDGKLKVDKTQKPVNQKRRISFIQIKRDFASTFMPEIMPVAKKKAPTMYEMIEAL